MKSKISIILPNRNHAQYLKDSIQALLSQTRLPDEILIIDDQSSDESVSLIKELAKRHSIICLIENKQNVGVVNAMNQGLKRAKGDLIAFCAADDIVFADFCSATASLLEFHSELPLCTSIPSFFYDGPSYQFFIDKHFPHLSESCFSKEEVCRLLKTTKFWVASHCTLFRKKNLLEKGGYNKDLSWMCDWHMNHTLALEYGVGFIKSSLAAQRLHAQSFSTQSKKKASAQHAFFTLFECLEEEKMAGVFSSTGLLTHQGSEILNYLLCCPKLWKFIPHFLLKKLNNLIKKVI